MILILLVFLSVDIKKITEVRPSDQSPIWEKLERHQPDPEQCLSLVSFKAV